MPSTEFENPLDAEAREWVRVRITTESGGVTAFTVQYETTIGGVRTPVARYDSAHGRPHLDLLDPHGRSIDKRWLPEHLSLNEVVTEAIKDFDANWERYQFDFLIRRQLPTPRRPRNRDRRRRS